MINIEPEKIYERLTKAGTEWCDCDHAASLLEETTKTVLAECLLRYKEGRGVSEAEQMARCDKQYKDHIKLAVDARRESNKARVRYDSAKMWFEALRTKAATLRMEMKL